MVEGSTLFRFFDHVFARVRKSLKSLPLRALILCQDKAARSLRRIDGAHWADAFG
jgi:hypothetical protein